MTASLKSIYASLPHTKRATAMVLNGDPKGQNILYANGKTVVIRDINNPGVADTYSQHSVQTTVAQYSPSGYYIASGDISGKVRIWDTVNKEHILKFECQPFAGPIRDICWDPDSKRIAVCGQGRETFGAVFMWDSGSTLGKIIGHSKTINSISYKPTRPYRIATAGEDFTCCFYEGPPFKLKHKNDKDHSNFINCVRFSPDGSHFCSVGSDKKAILFDGKTGERVCYLGDPAKKEAHSGGIYGVSWSPDGSQVLTASADKTCKIWDVSTQQETTVFKIGSQISDQQLGCLWQGEHIMSVSLSGNINYLDRNNPDKPLRILEGQNTNLNSICASPDGSYLYCGSNDGRISYWNTSSGDVGVLKGAGHSGNLVCSLIASEDTLFSLGYDKSLRQTPTSSFEYSSDGVSFPDKDPKSLARSSDGLILVATLTDLYLVRNGTIVNSIPAQGEPLSAVFNPTRAEVAVGAKDSLVYIYSTEGDSLSLIKEIKTRGEVNAIDYDPRGELLAVSGYAKVITVFNTQSYESVAEFVKHTARVTGVKFSDDGKFIVSSGIDTNVCIHNMETEKSNIIKGAHPLGVINGITWINSNTFATCADDCCIRVWEFSR